MVGIRDCVVLMSAFSGGYRDMPELSSDVVLRRVSACLGPDRKACPTRAAGGHPELGPPTLIVLAAPAATKGRPTARKS
jgi:hypothetical protein